MLAFSPAPSCPNRHCRRPFPTSRRTFRGLGDAARSRHADLRQQRRDGHRVGGVRIDYGGNRLVAERVTYDRASRRLIASGNVQIVDPDGTKIYSDEIDVTDDFADGFVNALRVETVDKTYFAAESAERRGGILTTFNNGVYTACEPCEEKPDKAPIWRIKAKRIIWNSKAKTVRFENSGFEFFGIPLGMLPAFEIADPTVKRKIRLSVPGHQVPAASSASASPFPTISRFRPPTT